jgi:hypothetical protein
MILITGASQNHYLSLDNFIYSFVKYNQTNTLIVYDLGIDTPTWKELQEIYLEYSYIQFKEFDYSKYPEWFNINIDAGQYAWKPTIIYETYQEYPNEILVWMDSGNLIHNDLNELEKDIIEYGIHSSVSGGNIQEWTHPTTIEFMNCNWTEKENKCGTCIGFDTTSIQVQQLIQDFYHYAQIKECIAPDGSNRQNHRQDQAVFSILFHKYNFYRGRTQFIGYSIHNDVENS